MIRSLRLLLSAELVAHILQQKPAFPKKNAIYDYRVTLDLATMLFARGYYFSLCEEWWVHIRLDSSPQFGRDYFMGEVDVIYPKDVKNFASLEKGKLVTELVTRMLPGQCLGARATGLAVKTRKLLHMLALESQHLAGTLSRCCSYLSDFGVEHGIAQAPASMLKAALHEVNVSPSLIRFSRTQEILIVSLFAIGILIGVCGFV